MALSGPLTSSPSSVHRPTVVGRPGPRGRNSRMNGLMSRTGVPTTASRPRTSSHPGPMSTNSHVVIPIRSDGLSPAGPDSDARPIPVSLGGAGHLGRWVFADPIEDEHDLHMRERLETSSSRLLQNLAGGTQFDVRAHRAPVVVHDLCSDANHAPIAVIGTSCIRLSFTSTSILSSRQKNTRMNVLAK